MNWTINGTVFAAQGLANVTRERFNLATDRMTFEAPGRGIDQPLLFTFDQPVEIRRDGNPFFLGRAGRTPINGMPNSEGHSYEILGPWDQLERLTFMQRWLSGSWVGTNWVPEMKYKSSCILGQAEDGSAIPLGQVIGTVIDYAISCRVSIARGVIDMGPFVPWEEVVDLSCAEVIRRMARWLPGAVGYFDYSSTPPKFNFRPVGASVPATFPVTNTSALSLTQVGSRSVPAVVLIYERTDTVDQNSVSTQVIDAWPATATGREIGAIVQTIGLSGWNKSVQYQKILADALPALTPQDIKDWFLEKHPEWVDPRFPGDFAPKFNQAQITGVSRKWHHLPYELIEGSLQDWMRKFINGLSNPSAVYPFEDRADNITVTLNYRILDANGEPLRVVEGEVVNTKITATDCKSGTYQRSTIEATGEDIPMGLAQYLYNVLNATHYQGSITLNSEEVDGAIGLGNRILISGGNPAWLTMSAIVQSVNEHLDTGTTQITVGPPSHLTPSDITELRRANRCRKLADASGSRVSGQSAQEAILLSSAAPRGYGGGSPGKWGQRLEQIITDVRFDSSSNCLQVKTRSVVVQYADAVSDWTTIEGGQAEICDDSQS